MARGSRNRNRYSERDALPSLTVSRLSRAVPLSHNLSSIQDFRTFDFAPASRPALLFTGGKASVRAAPARSGSSRSRALLPSKIMFASPDRVIVCVRRKKRREVLFAKRRTGRGSRGPRRFNRFSQIRC